MNFSYTFSYAGWKQATVTVRAWDYAEADLKARGVMDKRYAKQGKEPPVGWTLVLVKTTDTAEIWRLE